MANTPDFARMMKDMMPSFMDVTAFQNALRSQVALNEKISRVAFDAAERSADLSAKWTRESLARLSEVSKARDDIAAYSKVGSDFASATTEAAAESLSALADIAKKAQMDAMELVMSAGKSLQEQATSAVKTATAEAGAAMRKPGAAAA